MERKSEIFRTKEVIALNDYEIEICANCKHNAKDDENYYCNNEDSDCYGLPTMYDDSCEDFEEKEI